MFVKYEKIGQEIKDDDSTGGSDHIVERAPPKPQWSLRIVSCLLFLSVCWNVAMTTWRPLNSDKSSVSTSYTGLSRDVMKEYPGADSPWRDDDSLWDDPRLGLQNGVVAVDRAWATEQGLPDSQRWPWDGQKGIYVVNAYHNLHCVLELRRSVKHSAAGEPQTIPLPHLLHCLDILRDEIMCAADDTLRYTGRLYSQVDVETPHSGFAQQRICRDWNRLYDWTVNNSACYQPLQALPGADPNMPESEKYKFCKNGQRPWEHQA